MEGAALLSCAALEVLRVDQTALLTYLRGRDGARRGHLLLLRSRAQRLWAGQGGGGAGPGGGAWEGVPRLSQSQSLTRVGGPAYSGGGEGRSIRATREV